MRRFAFVFVLLILPTIIRAQNSNFSMDVSQLRAETVYFEIQGTPYYDENYRLGHVHFKGEDYTLFFRYNALRDRIELKDRTKRLFHMQKDAILEPTFGGKTYKYMYYAEGEGLERGYLIPILKGKVSLYYKPKKVFIQAQSPDHGYHSFSPPHYKDVSVYYLQFGNELPQPVKLSRNTFLNKLADGDTELKEYIRTQELDLRQENDAVKLLGYYNRTI